MTALAHVQPYVRHHAPSPEDRFLRIEVGLRRAAEALQGLRLSELGGADRVEVLAGPRHSLERDTRSLRSQGRLPVKYADTASISLTSLFDLAPAACLPCDLSPEVA